MKNQRPVFNAVKVMTSTSSGVFRIVLLSLSCCLLVGSKGVKVPHESGLEIPDGYEIERVAAPDLHAYPMFGSFDDRGRLFVVESTGPNTMGTEQMLATPAYQVRLLTDTDSDGHFDKSSIFAKEIPFPKGGTFFQGSLYVAESPNLVRYTDTDDDGVSDKREVLLTGWNLHANGASLTGPFLGPDGWLYLPDARRGFNITTKEGKVLKGKGARIWRCRPDGTGLEAMAGGGFDNSIEMIFMPGGETIGTMTYFRDPQDGERDAVMHWVEGGTYPKPNSVIAEDGLKLTGELMPVMTRMPRVAPAGLMRYRNTSLGDGLQGNLFHAEFNTGRIIRHKVFAEGATFRTEDEVFLKSSGIDVHPTDVFEDADGSILVILTGGWFVEGCPLSRVAKPEVTGGIFRLRKKGAVPVADPWGNRLNMEKLSAKMLTPYLSDNRPFVRDRAIELLVSKGNVAVAPLIASMNLLKNEELRAAALFALARIGTKEAMDRVRLGLSDTSPVVQTAAARSVGLAKDAKSVGKLSSIIQAQTGAPARQAATALGQIGDKKATEALLKGIAKQQDRFTDHAIIFSLITLQTPETLINALNDPSWRVRNAAIIALDQMDGAPLIKEHLENVLASNNSELRNTGIWVASHHPDWTDLIVGFLKNHLKESMSEEDSQMLRELMVTFSKEDLLQEFVSKQLAASDASTQRKLFLLDVMSNSTLKQFPRSWVQRTGKLLSDGNPAVRVEALNLVSSRRLEALNNILDGMVADGKTSQDLRLKALNARLMSSSKLSKAEFEMLMNSLDVRNSAPVRQTAVRLLSRADLDDQQLFRIADQQIEQVDLFLLPGLLDVFEGNKSEKVGNRLIAGLLAHPERLNNLSEQTVTTLFSKFPEAVRTKSISILETLRARHAERLAQLKQMELQLKGGDVGEGRKLFYGKASCSLCHAVGGQGGRFGPDLNNIGEIRSMHDILEAVVYPSASFAREYETSKVNTRTGSYTGVIKEDLADVVVIEVGPVPAIRIPRSEIIGIEPQTVSMMPPGLDQQLTKAEMADLTAFLQALPYRLDRMIQAREQK
jgi:putative membrane-bound dehydrogenase-like protein